MSDVPSLADRCDLGCEVPLYSSTFNSVRYSQIATAKGREIILRDRPAVYAWYRNLNIAEATGSAEAFLSKIESFLVGKLSDLFQGKLGYLYEISVQESGGRLGKRNLALLEAIANDAKARSRLAVILNDATFLQAPLYVGKAVDLRRRIGEHLTGGSDLADRFQAAQIPIDSCILRYKYIEPLDLQTIASSCSVDASNSDVQPEDLVAVLIEELLTRLSPSAFVRKPG